MSDIKIFVSNRIDLNSELISNPLFIPVRCGAVFDSRPETTILGDNSGENISERRKTFNELTVQYWAWKNVDADYYGLCHYRRYMIFSKKELQADPYGNVLFDMLNYDSCMECGLLDPVRMRKIIEENDFIVSVPYDVTYRGFRNLYEHYTEVPMQHRKDMETALEVVRELTPEYTEAAEAYFNGTLFYPCNLFIMRKPIFEEYCQWLFTLLFELEKRIDISEYDEQEQRVFGMLGERLFGVFFTQYIKTHPNCKYRIVQRALFWHTEQNYECQKTKIKSIKRTVKKCLGESSYIYRFLKSIYYLFDGRE